MEMSSVMSMDAFSSEEIEKKYEMTDQSIKITGNNGEIVTLHRIRALRDFGSVKAGDLGGWIEKESNLSQRGNCWIQDGEHPDRNQTVESADEQSAGQCIVYDSAVVKDDAMIYGSCISGYAAVTDKAVVCNSTLTGNALVSDDARVVNTVVSSYACIKGHAIVVNSEMDWHTCVEDDGRAINTEIADNGKLNGNALVYDTTVNGDTVYSFGDLVVRNRSIY